mmetsp:Transcript_7754/g.12034  ORF Transcript_7754/g.12034 Transcript_7754/m.12034 type:complete len:229 (+) Transcript_7754:807-1493(+)
MCSGVFHCRGMRTLGSAPAPRRALMISGLPSRAATCSGVAPSRFFCRTRAGRFFMRIGTAAGPHPAPDTSSRARWSAFDPQEFFSLDMGRALYRMRVFTQSARDGIEAVSSPSSFRLISPKRKELPSARGRLALAPALRRALAISNRRLATAIRSGNLFLLSLASRSALFSIQASTISRWPLATPSSRGVAPSASSRDSSSLETTVAPAVACVDCRRALKACTSPLKA